MSAAAIILSLLIAPHPQRLNQLPYFAGLSDYGYCHNPPDRKAAAVRRVCRL
jgi:hypothetical protein